MALILSPSVWANLSDPVKWEYLHWSATCYPVQPTSDDVTKTFLQLWQFAENHSCIVCRHHMSTFLRKNPPRLASRVQYACWTWVFHNAVNLRLGKPIFSSLDFVARYYPTSPVGQNVMNAIKKLQTSVSIEF